MGQVMYKKLALHISGKILGRLQMFNGGNLTFKAQCIHRQFTIRLNTYEKRLCSTLFRRHNRNHTPNARFNETDTVTKAVMVFRSKPFLHQPTHIGLAILHVLTHHNIQGQRICLRKAEFYGTGDNGCNMRQCIQSHCGRSNSCAGKGLCSGFAFFTIHGTYISHLDTLNPCFRYQIDRISTLFIERSNNIVHHINENRVVTALEIKLSQKSTANTARTKMYSCFAHL